MTLNDLIDNGDPREIKRALAVKMAVSGYSYSAIGELLSIVPSFVTKWKTAYYESGTEGLFLAHKGSESYLTKEERAEINDYIKSKDSIEINELISYIEDKYEVKYSSLKSYYDLLHEAGMSWKKTEKSNPKKDESAVLEKREEIKKNFWIKRTTSGTCA